MTLTQRIAWLRLQGYAWNSFTLSWHRIDKSGWVHFVSPDGRVYLEGPHYPKPHRWYAQAELHDGCLVKVK